MNRRLASSIRPPFLTRLGLLLPVLVCAGALLAGSLAGCGSYRPGQPAGSPAVDQGQSTRVTPPPPPGPPRTWPYSEPAGVPEGMKLQRRLKVVSFGAGSASLDGEARGALGIAAEELVTNPAWHVLVVGHADNQGEKAGGVNLGQSRARAAAEHLRGKGVARERLSVQSLGSAYAEGDRYALEQVRRDRRVELWVFLP